MLAYHQETEQRTLGSEVNEHCMTVWVLKRTTLAKFRVKFDQH